MKKLFLKVLVLAAIAKVQTVEANFLGKFFAKKSASQNSCLSQEVTLENALENVLKKCGHAEIKGKNKLIMEDAHNIFCNSDGSVCLYGIYDGHSEEEIAQEYIAQHVANILNKTILENIKNGKDYDTALFDSYLQVDKDLPKELSYYQGTTAVTALIDEKQIIVANAGDSRAVLCSNGAAIALSEDHKPNRPDERARINAAGGHVSFNGCHRVNGILALSRALGDHELSPSVIPNPDIKMHTRSSADQFLILASDGVWDVIDNQFAVDIVKQQLEWGYTAQEAAMRLVNVALARQSTDDVSAIVIDLR